MAMERSWLRGEGLSSDEENKPLVVVVVGVCNQN